MTVVRNSKGERRGWRRLLMGGCVGMVGAIASCTILLDRYEYDLAIHLSESGAKMYGAYWCPHCARQKDYFNSASAEIPYVECDPEGFRAQPETCAEAGIVAYPTWVIDGAAYTGVQTIDTLAALSGFEPREALRRESEESVVPSGAPNGSGGFSPADGYP